MVKEQILQAFRSYISGEMPLCRLEDWVVSHLQGILHSGDGDAIALIDEADSRLIEVGEGITSEESMMGWIAGIVSEADTINANLCMGQILEFAILDVEESPSDAVIEPQAEPKLILAFA